MNGKFKLLVAIALIALAIALAGCGVVQNMSKQCGGDLAQGCITLFGEYEGNSTDARLDQLELNMHNLELNMQQMHNQVNMLSIDVGLSEVAIQVLQVQLNASLVQLTNLATGQRIMALLDCNGDGPGFDEVVLRLSNGTLMAYFEQSGRRFLSTLGPGSYATTDAANCPFTINSAGLFCDSLGCR